MDLMNIVLIWSQEDKKARKPLPTGKEPDD